MTIRNELIDELLAGRDPASVMRQDGLLGELRQALLNRLMAAEFDHHMEQDRAAGEGRNHRNGATRKRVLTGDGHVEVTIPRDREARFEPVLIGKYQRRLPGFDDRVISLYIRGMSTREIQGHLEELCGVEVSPTLISMVTDAAAAEAAELTSGPLCRSGADGPCIRRYQRPACPLYSSGTGQQTDDGSDQWAISRGPAWQPEAPSGNPDGRLRLRPATVGRRGQATGVPDLHLRVPHRRGWPELLRLHGGTKSSTVRRFGRIDLLTLQPPEQRDRRGSPGHLRGRRNRAGVLIRHGGDHDH